MKIDVFWIWFGCFWLAIGMQNYLTVKKSDFDISYNFKSQDTGSYGYGQINLTVENSDKLSIFDAQKIIQNDLKKTVGNDVSVVVLYISNVKSIRYWQPFWRTGESS